MSDQDNIPLDYTQLTGAIKQEQTNRTQGDDEQLPPEHNHNQRYIDSVNSVILSCILCSVAIIGVVLILLACIFRELGGQFVISAVSLGAALFVPTVWWIYSSLFTTVNNREKWDYIIIVPMVSMLIFGVFFMPYGKLLNEAVNRYYDYPTMTKVIISSIIQRDGQEEIIVNTYNSDNIPPRTPYTPLTSTPEYDTRYYDTRTRESESRTLDRENAATTTSGEQTPTNPHAQSTGVSPIQDWATTVTGTANNPTTPTSSAHTGKATETTPTLNIPEPINPTGQPTQPNTPIDAPVDDKEVQ